MSNNSLDFSLDRPDFGDNYPKSVSTASVYHRLGYTAGPAEEKGPGLVVLGSLPQFYYGPIFFFRDDINFS